MRLIKIFKSEDEALRFSEYLKENSIENSKEEIKDREGNISYQIWVHNEDLLDDANRYLEKFLKNPSVYTPKVVVEDMEIKRRPIFRWTPFFLMVSVFLYFVNFSQVLKIKKENPNQKYVLLTPIQKALLYDIPHVLIDMDKLLKEYNIDLTKELKDQPKDVQEKLRQIEEKPVWRGIYFKFLEGKSYKGPLFEKIREGEVWRLFTPCVLHTGFLHILFNMLWLWLLGRQIEERISKFKFIVFILAVGIITNTCQYLMSGPYFLGFSGVIMGMVGFIWSRQRKAPWEGYPLQKVVFLFLAIYVLLMLFLSFFSFAAKALDINLLAPNIANTAHITGAISGWLFGKMPYFSSKGASGER